MFKYLSDITLGVSVWLFLAEIDVGRVDRVKQIALPDVAKPLECAEGLHRTKD